MRKGLLAFATVGLLAIGGTAACGDTFGGLDQPGSAKTPKIGVILPDSKSSARWEGADRRFLEEAFQRAGVKYDIQNAQGDKSQFQTIAEQMITNGVTTLMIVNLDSGTGKAVLDKARSQGWRPSTTTASPWAARRSTTSASTTRPSANSRARACRSACPVRASSSRSCPI
ncbi:hypothetical protein GCM10027614_58820 [Micromonospora vulcania]